LFADFPVEDTRSTKQQSYSSIAMACIEEKSTTNIITLGNSIIYLNFVGKSYVLYNKVK
jgi:hypothetical protein